MRKLLILLITSFVYGQIEFEIHEFYTDTGFRSIYAIDVDGDIDIDMLSVSGQQNKIISWHENDGNENFTQHILSIDVIGSRKVLGVDLTGDDFIDILTFSSENHEIVWYENDGDANFTEHSFLLNADPWNLDIDDIDNDGDIDILATLGASGGQISWYENDGNGLFSHHIIHSGGIHGVSTVSFCDINSDGFKDIIAGTASSESALTWYENDGNENFIQHIISSSYSDFVHCKDIDGDNDMDVVTGSMDESTIRWHENYGSNTNFGEHIITNQASQPLDLHPVDIDGDSDIDFLYAPDDIDQPSIVLYKNDGYGSFILNEIDNQGIPHVNSIYSSDIDSDGDMDILTASENNCNSPDSDGYFCGLTWYENLLITLGCTNPNATNYDPEATEDDGSCCVELWGECYNIEETTELVLSGNDLFTEEIPPEIGNLTNLVSLDLGNNQLTGEIPVEIGNLTNLNYLYLQNNQLTGSIPLEIGNLIDLRYLWLSNPLTGSIPSEIGNLTNLESLIIGGATELSGPIPLEIGNLTSLTYLNLSQNSLIGNIPSEIGKI